jgi:hypothetical protein
MRGGVYAFKTRSFLSTKIEIPTNVKEAITLYYSDQSISDAFLKSLNEHYSNVINPENETFYTNQEKEILQKIKTFTSNTGDDNLSRLPISTSTSKQLIDALTQNGFLPTAEEFTTLFKSFVKEKDKLHRNPFKFNGLALALAIIHIYEDYVSKRPGKTGAPSPPSPSPPPDTTNIQQTYLFVFNPRQATSWDDVKEPIAGNSICHQRKRIRMITNTYGKPEPFGLSDRETAKYDMTKLQFDTLISDEIYTGLTLSKSLIQGTVEANCTKYHIVDTRSQGSSGEYKFYRIEKRTQNIDFTSIRHPTTCRNKRYIPVVITTVYKHAEDGIIEWTFIEYTHQQFVEVPPLPDICKDTNGRTPSRAVYSEVIESMEHILQLRLNPRNKDIHTINEHQPLIDLTMSISRSGGVTSPSVTSDGTIRYTLVMIDSGIWDVRTATQTQQTAFNIVNQNLSQSRTSYDMLQIKRFRVSNNMKGPHEITVIIEVKEMNPDGTLKRAICMGETFSEFEVLDTLRSANDRKFIKEANYSQVTSSGPGGF